MNLFGGFISVSGISFLMFCIFGILFVGYALGRITIKGVSLGDAGVFVVALLFGAVDESAWVWLNGKFSGKRLHKKHNDWSTPFAINITDQIDWRKKHQTVVVKVEDTNGAGGIWRGVMVGVRKK